MDNICLDNATHQWDNNSIGSNSCTVGVVGKKRLTESYVQVGIYFVIEQHIGHIRLLNSYILFQKVFSTLNMNLALVGTLVLEGKKHTHPL